MRLIAALATTALMIAMTPARADDHPCTAASEAVESARISGDLLLQVHRQEGDQGLLGDQVARAFLTVGDPDRARALLPLIDGPHTQSSILHDLTLAFYRQGRLPDAQETMTRLLALPLSGSHELTRRFVVWNGAFALGGLGRFEDAARWALRLSPDDGRFTVIAGLACDIAERSGPPEARRFFESWITRPKPASDGHMYLALSRFSSCVNDFGDALMYGRRYKNAWARTDAERSAVERLIASGNLGDAEQIARSSPTLRESLLIQVAAAHARRGDPARAGRLSATVWDLARHDNGPAIYLYHVWRGLMTVHLLTNDHPRALRAAASAAVAARQTFFKGKTLAALFAELSRSNPGHLRSDIFFAGLGAGHLAEAARELLRQGQYEDALVVADKAMEFLPDLDGPAQEDVLVAIYAARAAGGRCRGLKSVREALATLPSRQRARAYASLAITLSHAAPNAAPSEHDHRDGMD